MTPDYKALSRGYSRDVSSDAIMRRLEKVADLYEVWRLLRTSRRVVREHRRLNEDSKEQIASSH